MIIQMYNTYLSCLEYEQQINSETNSCTKSGEHSQGSPFSPEPRLIHHAPRGVRDTVVHRQREGAVLLNNCEQIVLGRGFGQEDC
jgi:hypothetical protein